MKEDYPERVSIGAGFGPEKNFTNGLYAEVVVGSIATIGGYVDSLPSIHGKIMAYSLLRHELCLMEADGCTYRHGFEQDSDFARPHFSEKHAIPTVYDQRMWKDFSNQWYSPIRGWLPWDRSFMVSQRNIPGPKSLSWTNYTIHQLSVAHPTWWRPLTLQLCSKSWRIWHWPPHEVSLMSRPTVSITPAVAISCHQREYQYMLLRLSHSVARFRNGPYDSHRPYCSHLRQLSISYCSTIGSIRVPFFIRGRLTRVFRHSGIELERIPHSISIGVTYLSQARGVWEQLIHRTFDYWFSRHFS